MLSRFLVSCAESEGTQMVPSDISVPPHGAFAVLDGFRSVLAGPDPDRVLDADDEDLPVPHLALAGAAGDSELVDNGADDLRLHHRLHLEPRTERDVHRGAAVLLGVTALCAAALDLGDRDTRHAALVQHVLDLLQPLVPDDRDHHIHRQSASVRSHAGCTSCCAVPTGSRSGCGLTVGVSGWR